MHGGHMCFSFLPPRFSKLDLCLPIKLQEQVYFSYIGLIGIQIANYRSYHTASSAYNKHTASRSHRIRNDKTFRPLVLLRHVVVRPRPAEASWDTVGTKDLLWVLIVVTLEIGGWIFASRWWQLLDTILVSTWLDIWQHTNRVCKMDVFQTWKWKALINVFTRRWSRSFHIRYRDNDH